MQESMLWLFRVAMLAIMGGVFTLTALGWHRSTPVVMQYVEKIQESHVQMEDAQKQLLSAQTQQQVAQTQQLISQAQQQALLEKIVGLQEQFIQSMEIEVFLLSKPQDERPRLPMPEGMQRRLGPGVKTD